VFFLNTILEVKDSLRKMTNPKPYGSVPYTMLRDFMVTSCLSALFSKRVSHAKGLHKKSVYATCRENIS